ncbi:MAG TPA: MFS transporter [Acidimicrobiales bacterium]|nr:MFS transporter [Acidimicrobiales bacterium]
MMSSAAEPPLEDAEDALVDGDRTFAPGSARAALRHRTFRRVFYGSFLSNVGTWMQNVVLGALAYDLTHSATVVGVLLFAQLGPMLLLSVVAGALADAVDRRKLLVSVAFVQLVLSFVLAGVAAPDEPNLTALIGVTFALGIAQALFNPTYSALLPQLVGKDDLPGAISLHSAQMNGSRVVGPVIGALLDAALGASAVFAVNGLSYLFVIASLLTVRLPPPVPGPGDDRGLRRLGAGFLVARRNVIVRQCLVTVFTFSLVSLTFVGQFPVVAERNLGIDERSTAYGVLYACFGVGAMIGALSIGTVFAHRSKARIVRSSLVAYGASLTVFALLRAPEPAYLVVVIVGLAYFAFITSLSTVLQEQLADYERGRVMALWIMGFGGTVPIGNLLAGPVIDRTSITLVLLVGAAVAFGLAAYARLRPDGAGSAEQVEQALEAGDAAALEQDRVALGERT